MPTTGEKQQGHKCRAEKASDIASTLLKNAPVGKKAKKGNSNELIVDTVTTATETARKSRLLSSVASFQHYGKAFTDEDQGAGQATLIS
ncbi:hypothetical protein BOTCAL_0022g00130 [Botryotinia calthae]|uniref:Uncharacterized protein n=1 Tax=Botryotinia calthae TaxID=38488 RepID=A0A4Y8DEM6_9HELO|nr:hypothetical protein BOTCAL_0022g00130 [Botryotinia calthae]